MAILLFSLLVLLSIISFLRGTFLVYDQKYSFQSLQVNGIPVSGHEENYLLIDDQSTLTISQLLAKQGIKSISWQEATAFERREDDPDDHFLQYRQQYIKRSGRKFPPVYKIKFNITSEQLSDEDAKEFWEKQIWTDVDSQSEDSK
jgi:hypothetical protein